MCTRLVSRTRRSQTTGTMTAVTSPLGADTGAGCQQGLEGQTGEHDLQDLGWQV